MRIVVKSPAAALAARALLAPEKAVWSFGVMALACSTALFAYEVFRPHVSVQANFSAPAAPVLNWTKDSAFLASPATEITVKLPVLSAAYRRKVLYLWPRKSYLGRKYKVR
jgi:hypothetical protein